MKKIIEFIKKCFAPDYLTAEEEREILRKIIKKLKESY